MNPLMKIIAITLMGIGVLIIATAGAHAVVTISNVTDTPYYFNFDYSVDGTLVNTGQEDGYFIYTYWSASVLVGDVGAIVTFAHHVDPDNPGGYELLPGDGPAVFYSSPYVIGIYTDSKMWGHTVPQYEPPFTDIATVTQYMTGDPTEITGTFTVTHGAGPVAPEPISSTLFIVGGATLGFRRFRKKLRNI